MKKKEIINFLKKIDINSFTINEDLSVDIDEDVSLSYLSLKKIPFKFNRVNGTFDCSENLLDSLFNAPKIVTGNFICSSNNLKNLNFFPKYIGLNISIRHNKITSLKNIPEIINGNLASSNNDLKNFDHFPKHIKGNLFLFSNKINYEELSNFSTKVDGDVFTDFCSNELFDQKLKEVISSKEKEKILQIIKTVEQSKNKNNRL